MRRTAIYSFIAAAVAGVLAAGCSCFSHPGYRQENRPIVYRFHSSIPTAWHSQINAAAATWNAVHNVFSSGGTGGTGAYARDGVNSLFMTTFTKPTALAGAAIMNVNTSCGILEHDMGWNSAKSFSTTGAQYDVQTVALHEFGHYGVLDHVSCPSNSVMLDGYKGQRRTLATCDRQGWRVANTATTRCKKAQSSCRASLFGSTAAFDRLEDMDQPTVEPLTRNNEELNLIWAADATLRSSSDSVGTFYDALLEDWQDGGTSADYETFTAERYAELDAQVIARFYASASTPLRNDLDLLRMHLQSKIGRRIGDVYDGDVIKWPVFQSPGGDCGTMRVCS